MGLDRLIAIGCIGGIVLFGMVLAAVVAILLVG